MAFKRRKLISPSFAKKMEVLALILFLNLNQVIPFEGEVIYRNEYQNLDSDSLGSRLWLLMGDTTRLHIKESFYRKALSGYLKAIALYRGDRNLFYYFSSQSDTIQWIEATSNPLGPRINYTLEGSRESILGYECKKFVIEFESKKITYFFNEAIAVDPKGYAGHVLDNWNFYTTMCKAVPLRIITESAKAITISTAVRIESKRIDVTYFDLPEGRPLKRIIN